ncbi:hypothetical protein ACIBCB_31025 [Streptomyces uncialis]|uniref:hypothetical protein n=2 Tax=Streptomyces uncialis TaxID=1048205 RepID=UPI0037A6E583
MKMTHRTPVCDGAPLIRGADYANWLRGNKWTFKGRLCAAESGKEERKAYIGHFGDLREWLNESRLRVLFRERMISPIS